MEQPYIFNIQEFSVHDGPGIRTTVFFKGCPLRCKWCHNPESQLMQQEMMSGKDGNEGTVGKQYSVQELVKHLAKDQIFYDQSGGGVTLSGGEVMVQDMDYVVSLLKSLNRQGISAVIDTCGCAPTENFEKVLPYTELFLYDLKMMDPTAHHHYTGVSNELILQNLKYLSSSDANIELRLIMVKDVNMGEDAISRMIEWLKQEKIKLNRITLLPYHDLGRDKYKNLGRECTQNFEKPSPEELNAVKTQFQNSGYIVNIN